ncbi:MAG: hypothetical protein ACPGWR_22100 [Ardenticatenaceae bacterium]
MSQFTDLFKIIRELDLGEIKAGAEQRFSLLIVGDITLASALATNFSQKEGKVGIHPWVTVKALPLTLSESDLESYKLAVLVMREVEPNPTESDMLSRLHEVNVPTIVVVVNEAAMTRVGAELARGYETGRVVLPSLEPDIIQEQLVSNIITTLPSQHLPLARQFPLLRSIIIHDLIEDTSRANAIYAASTGLAEMIPVLDIPLNVADIVILTKNQLIMAYKIALANGKEGEPYDIFGEVVSVIGGGFLLREIARKLVGLIPVIGIVPKVAVSYAGTRVIGEIVYVWASGGRRLTSSEEGSYYDEAMAYGREFAESITKRITGDDEETPVLPAPDKKRWWNRLPGGDKQEASAQPAPAPAPDKKGWWGRWRGADEQEPSALPAPAPDEQEPSAPPAPALDEKGWWERFRSEKTSDSSSDSQ